MRRWEWPYRFGYTFAGNLHQYIYPPFRPPASFRILELQPGHGSTPIKCDIINASFKDAPGYEALSYRWGDLADTQTVICGGRSFPVTTNLHTALLSLRLPDKKRTLWVDALCINQRDYAERNQQLRLMERIYQRANKVIVWLGEGSEAVGRVKALFDKLRTLETRFGGLVYLNPSAKHLRDLDLPGESLPVWSALRYFFRRAWFQRVWVIQEVANASHLDVMCGKTHLKWYDLVFAARCIADSPMFAATDTALICRHLSFIDDCRRMRQQGTSDELSLFNLLYRSRRCGATDLRDKIYGLYPLVRDQSILPEPDYEKAIDTVYKETAVQLIKTTGRLDILSCAGAARDPRTRSLGLPSWVPDWHSYDKATPLAPATGPQSSPPEVKVSGDLGKLTLQGCIVDEIASISDTILPFHGTLKDEYVDVLLQQWPNAKALLEPTGEVVRVLDVFSQNTKSDDFNILHLPTASFTKAWLISERNQLTQVVYGRRLCRSVGGQLGLAPALATLGDRIVTFAGGSVPYAVRPKGNAYSLIGECFVGGLSSHSHHETEITLE